MTDEGSVTDSRIGIKIVIVVLIIIIVLGGGLYIWIHSLGGVEKVTVNITAGSEMYTVRLQSNVATGGTDEYNGEGTLIVKDESGLQTLQTTMDFIEGVCTTEFDFNDFCTGNGNYTFRVEVEGKSGEFIWEVSMVVETVDAVITHTQGSDPEVTFIFMDKNHRNLRPNISQECLELTIHLEIDNNGFTEDFWYENVVVNGNHHKVSFQRFGAELAGNYSFYITVTNLCVKDGTEGRDVIVENTTRLDNAPVISVGGPYSYSGILSKEVTLDGSGSTDDGEIVMYTWYFTDTRYQHLNYEETAGNAPDGAFDGRYNVGTLNTGDYEVTMIVTDNNYPLPNNASKTFTVSISFL